MNNYYIPYRKNYNIRNISCNKLRCFLAINILSGYNILPGRKLYDKKYNATRQIYRNRTCDGSRIDCGTIMKSAMINYLNFVFQ